MKKWSIMALLLALIILLAACHKDSKPSVAGRYVDEEPGEMLTDVLILREDGTFTRDGVIPVDGVKERIVDTGTYRIDNGRYWLKITGVKYSFLDLDEMDSDAIQAALDSIKDTVDAKIYNAYVKLFAGETVDGEEIFDEGTKTYMQKNEFEVILNTDAKTFRTVENE